MGNKFSRFHCCCLSVESTPHDFKVDLCCLHLGSGHIGTNDVGGMVIGCVCPSQVCMSACRGAEMCTC